MINDKGHTIFVEKYRPTSLKNYIAEEHFKNKLKSYIDQQDIPHLLFCGSAGTGKTTAGKILCKNIECDALFINASDENNVDTIRNKVKTFASSIGFKDLKVVFLDECLDENTLVRILRDGVEQNIVIKNLLDGTDLVKTWNVAESRVEWMPFKLWDKGIQDTLEIELENGEVVICTPDHKWYVEDDNGNPMIVKASQLDKYNHILSP